MQGTLNQHIVKTTGIVGGSPHIAGHRVRVLDIVVWHEKCGFSPDQIVDLFPGITLADVHAALAYYFDNTEEIEEEFRQESSIVSETKSQYPSKVRKELGG